MTPQKTLTLESLVSQIDCFNRQQKEDLYRSLTGLAKEDAQVIFDLDDNIKYAKLNSCKKAINIELRIAEVEETI